MSSVFVSLLVLLALLVGYGSSDEGVGVDVVKYGSENSSILVGDLDEDGYVLMYIEKNGQRAKNIFVCFGSGSCFYGTEETNQTYTIQKKQKTASQMISRDYAQYLFKFPRVVVETGPEVGYSFRLGTAGVDVQNAPSNKLFHMESSKPAARTENNSTGTDVKSIQLSYKAFDKLEDETLKAGVRSKKSPEEVKTVSFDEFYADRMIFSNAINDLDIDEKNEPL